MLVIFFLIVVVVVALAVIVVLIYLFSQAKREIAQQAENKFLLLAVLVHEKDKSGTLSKQKRLTGFKLSANWN